MNNYSNVSHLVVKLMLVTVFTVYTIAKDWGSLRS